jgi:hypothetical protein
MEKSNEKMPILLGPLGLLGALCGCKKQSGYRLLYQDQSNVSLLEIDFPFPSEKDDHQSEEAQQKRSR